MRNVKIDLDYVQDQNMDYMYESFGLDVKEKSYADFERRMLQISIDTIVEVKHRTKNKESCQKWIYVLEDLQQKNEFIYVIWGA